MYKKISIKEALFAFCLICISTPTSSATDYWVNSDRVDRRTCPSDKCGLVGQLFFPFARLDGAMQDIVFQKMLHKGGAKTERGKFKKIAYARVSTDDQNLDLQMDALTKAGCERIFADQGVSGATIEREGLGQAIAAVGKGDVLVVWKLDRLGRSLSFLIELIEKLREERAGFESLSDDINTTGAGGKLVFHIMGALAEFERSLISERSKAGMQATRRRGKHIGRPHKLNREQITHAKRMIQEGRETVSVMTELLSVDRTTLYRALSRR